MLLSNSIKVEQSSYTKVYTIDIVYTLAYDGGVKGDDRYVNGTGDCCKKRMERGLR